MVFFKGQHYNSSNKISISGVLNPNAMSSETDNNLTQPENHAFVNMKFEFEKNSFSLPKGFKRAKDIHFSPLQLSKVK